MHDDRIKRDSMLKHNHNSELKKTHQKHRTQVEIQTLNDDERALATAQIISSETVDHSALEHAKNLIKAATEH